MTASTEQIANEIDSAKSWEEVETILKKYHVGEKTFGDRVLELCDKYKIKPSKLQLKVAISKSQFYATLNGTKKPSKEQVIIIALNLGVELEELNELLKLANYKELYVKNVEDAVIRFALKEHTDIYELNKLLKKYGSKLQLIDEKE